MASSAGVVQVVDEVGEFNNGLEDFVQRSTVGNAGTDYQIVAITGPQSSGKSTLMNVLVSRIRMLRMQPDCPLVLCSGLRFR